MDFLTRFFEKVFDWMSLQRSLKAAGTFGFMAAERKNENYLHYLPRVFHNSLRVLNKYPEFKDAKEILEPHFK